MKGSLLGIAFAAVVLLPKTSPALDDRPSRLSGRLSAETAERLTESDDAHERIRGFERLGTMGTAKAVARLTAALGPGGAAKTPLERLVVVRNLDAHRNDRLVQRALIRTLTEGLEARIGPVEEAMAALVRATAATLLSRTESRSALKALAGALRTVGPAAEAAERALAAHPSSSIVPLLARSATPSAREVRVLERLRDQRAFSTLRRLVRTAPSPIAAAAAVALTRLGHFETVPLAHSWVQKRGPRRDAAMQILSMAHDPKASVLIESALRAPSRFEKGLAAALESGAADLVRPLVPHLTGQRTETEATLLTALSRIGTDQAVDALARHVQSPAGPLAAYALSRVPGPAASRAIAALIAKGGQARSLGLRAAAVRNAALGEVDPDWISTAEQLLTSKDPVERSAAATLIASADSERLGQLIDSDDPVTVRAAARWLGDNPVAARAAARRLQRETDPATTETLAACLASPEARTIVPTSTLLDLIERGGAAMPIAALALAERDRPDLSDDVRSLLSSPNQLVRRQVALGLARKSDPRALGWLEAAYRAEADRRVRLALVRAAALRPEAARRRLLDLTARLDPSLAVTSIARLARRGVVSSVASPLRGVAWADVQGQHGKDVAIVLVLPTGEAVPMLADPDGVVVAGRLPRGSVVVRVASGAERDQAPRRDRQETDPQEGGRAREQGSGDVRGLDSTSRRDRGDARKR